MNLEKHKKDPVREWLEEEDNLVPAHSRSPRVLGSYIKIGKPAGSKAHPASKRGEAEADPAIILREPGPAPKFEDRTSQSAAWDHLQKLNRLPRMRAPHASELHRTTRPAQPPKVSAAGRQTRRPSGKA